MDADPIRRCHVLWHCIYPADHRAERNESDGCIVILSLESVVSVIAGFLILHQTLSLRELIGCVLMFAAIILVQLPDRKK